MHHGESQEEEATSFPSVNGLTSSLLQPLFDGGQLSALHAKSKTMAMYESFKTISLLVSFYKLCNFYRFCCFVNCTPERITVSLQLACQISHSVVSRLDE